ncbi:MAG TPA: hypothetical protein VNN74_07595 [Candidatus Micrarchaeia archaeon]|nr:hypothetical protein [Candidatus Micrarchaeia archaeon]
MRSAWNRLQVRTRTPLRLAGYLAMLLALGAVAGALTYGIGFGVGTVAARASTGLLTAALTGYAVLTLVLGLSSVITAFFLGSELTLLTLAPLDISVIFLARLLVAVRTNALLGLLLLVGLAGFGTAHRAGPMFLLLGVVVALSLPIATTALQLLILAVVLRLVPPRIARDVANVAGAFVTAVLYVGWLVLTRSGGHRLAAAIPPRAALSSVVALGRRGAWLPTAWPAHALADAAAGLWGGATSWLLLTVGATALVVAAAHLAYRRALVSGMGAMAEAAPRRRSARRAARRRATETADGGRESDRGQGDGAAPEGWSMAAALEGVGFRHAPAGARPGARPRPRLTSAMARKDWRSLRRDLRRLGRLVPALVVAFAYPAVAVPSLHLGGGGGLSFWEGVAVTPFVPFLLSEVLAVPAVPLEGRAIQLLRQSPISAASLVRAKVASTALLVAGLSLPVALAIGVIRRGSPAELAILAVGIVWLALGLVAVAVGAGAAAPNYGAADPRRAVRGVGLLVANLVGLWFVASSLLAGTYLLAILRVPGSHLLHAILPGAMIAATGPDPSIILIPLLLLGSGALAVGMVVAVGIRRLARWEPSLGDGSG